jgi:hypothetical protein
MWRLIKFLFTGDGHLHKWKFTRADFFTGVDYEGGRESLDVNVTYYVKVCEICGAHKEGKIYNCRARTGDELNP